MTPETQALHSLPPAAREALARGTGPGWAIGTNPDGSPYQRVYSSPAEWMRCRARARGTVGAPLNGVVGWAWLPADAEEVLDAAAAFLVSRGCVNPDPHMFRLGGRRFARMNGRLPSGMLIEAKGDGETGRLAALHLLAAVWSS